jgi:8-oxo-dGTP diphosphatase
MAEADVPSFGRAPPGVACRERPGGYALLFRDGAVAVVATKQGLFLPGGGQEAGEGPLEAAVREVLEECALHVEIEALVAVADELVDAPLDGGFLRKRCAFFAARVLGAEAGRAPEHEVRWIPVAEAVRGLAHGSQRWAVGQAWARVAGET